MPADPIGLPSFLRFTPVPVKSRRDGWTADCQLRFILALARGDTVEQAARRIGRSRQGAYALRRRAGADGFAAAWDAALDLADRTRGLGSRGAGGLGLGTLLVPRFYRGRLIGFVQRDDTTGLIATLGRLDRLAGRIDADPARREVVRNAAERLPPRFGQS